jgi:hypothetical protein
METEGALLVKKDPSFEHTFCHLNPINMYKRDYYSAITLVLNIRFQISQLNLLLFTLMMGAEISPDTPVSIIKTTKFHKHGP